ncbi:MAG: phosphosulfolactate synthase [Bacteroidia bacterium]|nr:phosphosulfolactate synthase [Bacteroidia bacterium]
MNFILKNIPKRTQKPRQNGITLALDKGFSILEVEQWLSVAAEYIDVVKLGWGTAYVTPKLTDKISLYQSAGIPVYFGGTLFEAFVVRHQFEDYIRILHQYKLQFAEVSDGSINIPHEQKLKYIQRLSQEFTVLSEVGSKDVNKVIAPYRWIEMMKAELEAGSWKVITEAREAGNAGIFRTTGEVREGLIEEILNSISAEKIIFEAPKKEQQVWFIKLLGSNVNLGNIAPNDVIPLETIRLGLRGDTFFEFLDTSTQSDLSH